MKQHPTLTYTFINPNTPSTCEEALKKILLDRLLTQFTDPKHLP